MGRSRVVTRPTCREWRSAEGFYPKVAAERWSKTSSSCNNIILYKWIFRPTHIHPTARPERRTPGPSLLVGRARLSPRIIKYYYIYTYVKRAAYFRVGYFFDGNIHGGGRLRGNQKYNKTTSVYYIREIVLLVPVWFTPSGVNALRFLNSTSLYTLTYRMFPKTLRATCRVNLRNFVFGFSRVPPPPPTQRWE